MAESAVLEAPGTIAPVEEAPSFAEETELTDAVETGAQDQDDVEPSPLDDLDDETIVKHPKVAKLLEAEKFQREQAVRDAKEAAATAASQAATTAERNANLQRLQAQASGENRDRILGTFNAEFERLKEALENGKDVRPNWQFLKSQADGIDLASKTRGMSSMKDALFAYQREFYPDHKVDPEVLAYVEQAQAQNNPEAVMQLWLVNHDVAVRAQAIKDYETQRAQERAGNAAQDSKAAKVQAGAEARANGPKPTNISGASQGRRYTNAEIEAIPTREWDAMPDDRRAWILNNRKS